LKLHAEKYKIRIPTIVRSSKIKLRERKSNAPYDNPSHIFEAYVGSTP